jgi:two-component SAPR family response regulator
MAQEVKYGLEFASHEVEKENRTSLDLTPVKPFKFSKGFSISFDVLFKQESKQIFGYILRIIGNNNQNIDLVLSSEKGILYPNIVATSSKTESLVNYLFSENNNTFNQWIPIAITFEMDKKRLDISIGNKRYTFENSNLNDFKDVRIVFGKNDYLKSQIIDVPPMVIKNITISDARQKPLYYWDLSKHTSEGIYDDLKNHFAVCSNPIWIIDRHAQWEKLLSINTKSNPQICYNEKTNDVAIADKKVFITYNTNNNILKKDSLVYGQPHGNLINQLIYNLFTNKYCSYSFEKKITYYDSLKKSWNNNSPDFDQYHWHHNRYLYPGDSCLYIFFGYGHHKYKNNILKYNFKTDSMETISFHGDTIPPRYLSGLGKIDDDRIIIFGGHGSVSGNQELAPHNYYDSYIINLRSKRIKKLWELNISDKSFVVANSLVVDTIRHCFYTLCYPQQEFRTHLMLYRFSLDLPEYEILADSIPFAFHDIYSYTDLFLNKEKRELIALTSSPLIPDSTSFLSIYTLAYPPLARADLIQKETRQNNKLTLALILIISMLGLYGGYFVYNRMKKKMRKQEKEQVNEISVSVSNPENEEEIVSSGIKPVNIQLKKQSIFLFGGFQVIDKEGQDITKEFTPLLEHLFLIILLYTLKDGKGISSVKLREILWFDKNEESAKNNRGVALNKLRQIFEPVGIIHINKQYLSWIIEFGEDIYCDYYEALILMNRLKDRGNRTTKDIKRLLSIVSAGELLHHLQVEWIDSFKADFSNNLIDLFLDIAQQNELDISMQNKIDLAESILIHDSLNEDALKLKCSILVKMGKNGLAKMAYSSFSKEYRLLFGTDFKYSFEQMISQ